MQPASVPQPTFPEKVGKYELLLPIGTGGMATVYLARTVDADGRERHVALKLVHAHLRADKESKLHLLEEAKLAALIHHPNVIQVLEIDEDPFGVFLVMDYVAGESLSGLLRLAKEARVTTPWRLIARILNDALLGLHAAHELRDTNGRALGLVHRDFSPQNILVSMQGETLLGDFGVAKAADRAVRTKTGLTKGKIAYMSPEQARGHAVDRRCDVWAAGVLAWELIARQRLYRSDDDVATLLSIVTEQPPRLSHVLPTIPKDLDAAVSSALQPTLDSRCPTAEEFRLRLASAWEAADGMADPAELSHFMARVVGPELESRNERITHVKSLRQRPKQYRESQSAPPASAPIPLQLVETISDLPSAPSGRYAADLIRTPLDIAEDSVTIQAIYSAGERPVGVRLVGPAPGAELTETSAVVPTFRPQVRRGQKVAGAVVAVSAVVALIWAASFSKTGKDETESAAAAEAEAEVAKGNGQSDTAGTAANAAAAGPASSAAHASVGNDQEEGSMTSTRLGQNGTAGDPNGAPAEGTVAGTAGGRVRTAPPRTAPPRTAPPRTAPPRNTPPRNTRTTKPEGAPPAQSPSKPTGRDKPKLATSPYAGSKSGE
jgi:serine/threonine protein kinase